MRQSFIAISCLSFFIIPASIHAQTAKDSLYREVKQLDNVVVTGTRTPKTVDKTPVLTKLITRQDIINADATNLRDLLQETMPGVEFSYAMNQQVHFDFSGFGGQSVLVLVDGERLAGETMDDVDFSRLTMENVDHVEIVKGAASALYGSNATGGVINVITKKSVKPFGLNLNARLGRHGEQRYGLSMQNAGLKWGNNFSVSRNASDNYDISNGPNPTARVIATIYGDNTWNVNDRLSFTPTSRLKLSAHAGYFFRQVKRTADAPERYRDFSGGVRGEWAMGPHQTLEGSYNFDQYDKSNFYETRNADVRFYSNVQNSARLLYNNYLGKDVLTVGTDFLYDYLYNNKLNRTPRQQSFDVFSQYDWTLNNLFEIVGALRYDYFSDHHSSRLTPKLSIRHTPLKHLNVRFGYGMGFRAPTLKEKYYDFDMLNVWIIEGNPNLKDEVSNNFNFSLEYTRSNYSFLINGYCNVVHNKITPGNVYYKNEGDDTPYLPYINLPKYRVSGVEAQARFRWSFGLSTRLAYNYTHEDVMRNNGSVLISNYLPARKHSITANVDYSHSFSSFYTLSINLSGRWLSGMDNYEYSDYLNIADGPSRVHYPGYCLWKLNVQNRLGKHFRLTVAFENLLNYKPEYHYLNSPLTDGINCRIGASIDI